MGSGLAVGQPAAGPPVAKARVKADYGRLPLSFAAAEDGSSFLARGSGYSVYLTRDGALLRLGTDDAVAMKLEGARASLPVAKDLLPGKVNYFIGNDPKRWRTNLPTYAKVAYAGVYPGVDLLYYGNHQALEYDLLLAPRSSVKPIRIQFAGAKLSLEQNGDLKIQGPHGAIAFHQPIAYQMQGSNKQPVPARFVMISETEIGFTLGHYDHAQPLVIDPQLAYSTYFNNAGGGAIAVDSAGSAYITGDSAGGLPLTPGAFDTTNHQPPPPGAKNYIDSYAYVAKLSPDGESLAYSTYFGSVGGGEYPWAIAVDSAGDAYVVGQTGSQDLPVTPGAFQAQSPNLKGSAFLTKFNPSGSGLVYSTYLGGSKYGEDIAFGVAVNASGEAYVTGEAFSIDFPVTPGAYQTTNNAAAHGEPNAFVTRFNASGSGLIYSTYIGGSGDNGLGYPIGVPGSIDILFGFQGDEGVGIAVDTAADAYIVGNSTSIDYPTTPGAFQTTNKTATPPRLGQDYEPVVTKLNPTGTALLYSTYLGGRGTLTTGMDSTGKTVTAESPDFLSAIAVDASGNAYVAGQSGSSDYPVTADALQKTNKEIGSGASDWTSVFSVLNSAGSGLLYSTYLGGSKNSQGGGYLASNGPGTSPSDIANGIALDGNGNVYVAGNTSAPDFPVTPDALEETLHAQFGSPTTYFAAFHLPDFQMVYSTYLGGSVAEVLVGLASDKQGNAYLSGLTESSDFPVTANAFQTSLAGTPTRMNGMVFSPSAGFVTKIGFNTTGQNLILTRSTLTTSAAANGQTTLTATVTPLSIAPAEPVLTGDVTFYNNGSPLGSPVPVGNPATTASLTIPVPAGATSLSCAYSGDTYYAASNCPLQPDFSIALTNPTVTVQSGGNVTTAATLTSIGGFTDGIGVACTNVPAHIVCKVTPATTTLLAYNTATVSVFLDTSIPPIAQNHPRTPSPIQFAILLLPVGLLAGLRTRRMAARYATILSAVTLALSMIALTGCGEIIVPYQVPAGTYTIPITGTAQTSGITHTTQLTLVVTP